MMRIGLFIPTFKRNYNQVPASVWIRVLQMVKYYKMLGLSVHINNPFLTYDFAIVYRLPSKKYYCLVKLLRKTADKVYFDTVVNYFVKHDHNTDSHVFHQKKIAELCSGIICSTEPIAKAASHYNENVFVMDDPIEVVEFKPEDKIFQKEDAVFGWSGISVKATELNDWASAITQRIIITSDPNIKNMELAFDYTYRMWKHGCFSEDLRSCDVAFLPRRCCWDAYNSGHSSYKALAFAASGIPVIASALPSYRKLSTYFDGIVFLEDHNNDLDSCLSDLDGWNPKGKLDRIRQYYSCMNQAKRLLGFMNAE